jgi:hypothetical protein
MCSSSEAWEGMPIDQAAGRQQSLYEMAPSCRTAARGISHLTIQVINVAGGHPRLRTEPSLLTDSTIAVAHLAHLHRPCLGPWLILKLGTEWVAARPELSPKHCFRIAIAFCTYERIGTLMSLPSPAAGVPNQESIPNHARLQNGRPKEPFRPFHQPLFAQGSTWKVRGEAPHGGPRQQHASSTRQILILLDIAMRSSITTGTQATSASRRPPL